MSMRELNEKYGQHGLTFSDKRDAEAHADKYHGAFVTPIVDYHEDDYVRMAVSQKSGIAQKIVFRLRQDARKRVVAWLATTYRCPLKMERAKR